MDFKTKLIVIIGIILVAISLYQFYKNWCVHRKAYRCPSCKRRLTGTIKELPSQARVGGGVEIHETTKCPRCNAFCRRTRIYHNGRLTDTISWKRRG